MSDLQININGGGFAAATVSPIAFNNLAAGTYTIILRRVSDNTCSVTKTAAITQPDQLTLTLTPTGATCFGSSNGSISAAYTGTPMSDLQININAGAFVAATVSPIAFNNLAAGNYTIILRRVSDNTCSVTKTTAITQPDQLTLTLTPTNVTCFGGSNGAISAAYTGTPMSDLQVKLDAGAFVAATASPIAFNALAAGTHTVILRRVSDNSCLVTKTAAITQPDQLTLTLTPTGATCFGSANGSISAAYTGTPMSDLQININGGVFAAATVSPIAFNNLAAGTYTVILRRISDNTCSVTKTAAVTQPDQLTLTLTPTGATCFGSSNGSISAAYTGTPMSDLQININAGAFVAATVSPIAFNNLAAGNYTIILRRISDNTCLVTKTTAVTQPDQLTLTLTPTNATCYGSSNGSISAAYTGTPMSDLQININGGAFAAATVSPIAFNNLAAGNYTIILRRVSDNTCLVTKTTAITQPDQLTLTLTPTNVTCYGGSNGAISAAYTGTPMSDLQVKLDAGAFVAATASPIAFNGLTAGTHTVILRRVSDNTCLVTKTVAITQPDQLTLTLTPTGATCYGSSNGSISAAYTGTPMSDLQININGGAFAAATISPIAFNNLAAGTYTVILRRISDNTCLVTKTAAVTQPDQLTLTLTPTNVTCYGGSNGAISAAYTGTPMSDLQVKLDAGAFVAATASPIAFNGLTAGTHTVIIRRVSDNTCLVTKTTAITQPDQLTLTLTPTGATCYGASNGSISAAYTGTPMSDLQVKLDAGAFVAATASPITFSNLAAGTHTVIIRRVSDNTCLVTKTAAVTQPDQLTLTLTPTGATCYGVSNGSISAAYTGTPMSDLEIQLNALGYNPATPSPVVFNGLAAGDYTVTLRRASDHTCLISKTTTVVQPDQLGLSLTPIAPPCNGGNKQIKADFTGTPLSDLKLRLDAGVWKDVIAPSPFTFDNVDPVGPHTVDLVRKSDETCGVTKSTIVTEPTLLTCSTTVVKNASCGDIGGSATVTPIGGTPCLEEPFYQFLWDDLEVTQTAVNLASGLHWVAVLDCNNCVDTCYVDIPKDQCTGICTYTQGKYGNQGSSSACDLTGSIATSQMVANLLAIGDLEIGAGSNKMIFKAGDNWIIDNILPGGGGSGVLTGTCIPSVNYSCLNPYLSKQGRLKNTLLAQTITLGLNMRIGSPAPLGGVILTPGQYVVTQQRLDCPQGSGTVQMVCTPTYDPTTGEFTGYVMTVNPYGYLTFDAGVLCYMSQNGYPMTIAGLYALANDALGQVKTFPATVNCGGTSYTITLTSIAGEVDRVNNGFDECKAYVGTLPNMFTCPTTPPAMPSKSQPAATEGPVKVEVMPNPFTAMTNITFTSEINTTATVEIFDMQGKLVKKLFSGAIEGGTTNTVKFVSESSNPQLYMCVVRTEQGSVVKRIVEVR
jgi:hypothetical protein